MNTFCVGLIGAALIKPWLVTTITKSEFILLSIYNCNTAIAPASLCGGMENFSSTDVIKEEGQDFV
ncbi:hypothetical protein [Chroococcidiopsis cubana]|uniref:hypothetical protein n=1 Tax=Chroococcidiopsis cubana TaxID=171392 RepID=UPI000F8C772D|nr:hypothetical protein [Chroococcidiopsis cubana]